MNLTVSKMDNLYAEFTENRSSKVLCVIFSSLSAPLVALLFYGIAWYEQYGSDHRRTLINKLVSSQCWAVIQYFLLSQSADVLDYIVGALSEQVCLFQLIFKNALKTQVLLFIDMGLFIQYLFIFWLKNPAGINDDFWSLFLTMWIAGFSYIFYFVYFLLPGRKPPSFYICGNVDPKHDWTFPVSSSGHFEIFSLIFCLIVKLKVLYFKERFLNLNNQHDFQKNFAINDLQKTSLTSYFTNLSMLIVYLSFVVIAVKLSKLYPLEVNEYPNYIYLYFLQLVFPNLIGFTIAGILYGKNYSIKETIMVEVNNFVICNH